MSEPREVAERAPTAQARAVAALRAAILEGDLRPGQRVNQEAWAARVGVSLIPIREALGTLAGEGLVTYRPRRGYAVTELDLGELEEIYRIRRLLETDALERGVPHATDGDVERLRAAASACRAAAARGDAVDQLAANRALPRRAPRACRVGDARAPDRPAVGHDRGLSGPVLRLARRGRRCARSPRRRSWRRSPPVTATGRSGCRTRIASARSTRCGSRSADRRPPPSAPARCGAQAATTAEKRRASASRPALHVAGPRSSPNRAS